MTWHQFRDSIALVVAVFPSLSPSEETLASWYLLVNDLDDKRFHRAIMEFCRTEKQLYPGTNVVALLRERTENFMPKLTPTQNQVRLRLLAAVERNCLRDAASLTVR